MTIHCVIPAKGTSLGIVEKNLQKISGQSLLEITLRYTFSLHSCSNFVISTDSSAVLEEICKILKVKSPSLDSITEGAIYRICDKYWIHRRAPIHATPEAKTIEFLPQILNQLGALESDSVLLLQPTSPFRDVEEFEILRDLYKGVDSVVSVKLFDSPHPEKKVKIDLKGHLIQEEFVSEHLSMPRQKLRKYYVLDGAFYLTNCSIVIKENSLIGENTRVMIRSGIKTINIDNYDDLEIARSLVECGKAFIVKTSIDFNCQSN